MRFYNNKTVDNYGNFASCYRNKKSASDSEPVNADPDNINNVAVLGGARD